MSVSYYIDIKLNAEFNKKNIMHFLKKAEDLGFVYFDQIPGERYLDARTLDSSEAYEKLLNPGYDDIGPYLLVKFEDTYFDLSFYSESAKLDIHLGNFSCEWEKTFHLVEQNEILIDFARYIRTLLKICSDFVILDLSTEIEP